MGKNFIIWRTVPQQLFIDKKINSNKINYVTYLLQNFIWVTDVRQSINCNIILFKIDKNYTKLEIYNWIYSYYTKNS